MPVTYNLVTQIHSIQYLFSQTVKYAMFTLYGMCFDAGSLTPQHRLFLIASKYTGQISMGFEMPVRIFAYL